MVRLPPLTSPVETQCTASLQGRSGGDLEILSFFIDLRLIFYSLSFYLFDLCRPENKYSEDVVI